MSGEGQIPGILDGAPPWLQDPQSAAFLQTFSSCLYLLSGKSNCASRAGLPGYGDPSVIPLQAADRVMVQGPSESNASFIVRMQGFLDAWRVAGSRPAVLQEVQGYLTGLQPGVLATLPECLIVGGNSTYSRWDSLTFADAQGAPPARSIVTPMNWNWDGMANASRSWLVLFMHLVATGVSGSNATVASTGGSGVSGVTSGFATITGLSGMQSSDLQNYLTLTNAASSGNVGTFQITSVLSASSVIIANPKADASDLLNGVIDWSVGHYPFIAPAPVWGSPSFIWGTEAKWGVNCSPLVIDSIRNIVRTWKSASTYYPNIIVSFGGGDGTAGNEFSPLSAQGAGNPDGTWGNIGKNVGGVWVPAKTSLNAATSFCDGTGLSPQCFEKWIA